MNALNQVTEQEFDAVQNAWADTDPYGFAAVQYLPSMDMPQETEPAHYGAAFKAQAPQRKPLFWSARPASFVVGCALACACAVVLVLLCSGAPQ